MPLDGRVSNALGVPLPQWIIKQLDKRSLELSVPQDGTRSNDNVLFRGNRSSWVRAVSSVDLVASDSKKSTNANPINYFSNELGLSDINNKSDLAKKFVLQGGVSKYTKNETSFSYGPLGGLNESYNVAGKNEVKNYGYRPMPGITSVKVQTQGKLGSIRAAEVQLKVWDKAQLDIIDALYFKLGYTMFLEWGHTTYYKAGSNELQWGEDYSIDAFSDSNSSKEDIQNKISINVRRSEGNYDAMLGMITNFNFSYTQDGGYDCTIKIISLGVLISNTKINNPRVLPDLQDAVIKQLLDTVIKILRKSLLDEFRKNNPEINTATVVNTTTIKPLTFIEFFEERIKTTGIGKLRDYFYLPTEVSTTTQINSDTSDIVYDPQGFWGIRKFGVIISAVEAESQISSVTLSSSAIKGNIYTYLQKAKGLFKPKLFNIDNADDFGKLPALSEDQLPDTTTFLDKLKRFITGDNYDIFELAYTKEDNQEVFTGGKLKIELVKRNYKLYFFIGRSALQGTKGFLGWDEEPTDLEKSEVKKAVYREVFDKDLKVGKATMSFEKINLNSSKPNGPSVNEINRNPYTNKINVADLDRYRPNLFLYNSIQVDIPIDKSKDKDRLGTSKPIKIDFVVAVTESGIIKDISIKSGTTQNTVESINFENSKNPIVEIPPPPKPPEPTLDVSTIQKSESLKYRSAFEVMIRTIQLYSLNESIEEGKIEADRKPKKLNLLSEKNYNKFTKELFSKGLFTPVMDEIKNFSISKDKTNYLSDLINYDLYINEEKTQDENKKLLVRSLLGFNFGLMGNGGDSKKIAQDFYDNDLLVDYETMFTTCTVPYQFNAGIVEGTRMNYPVYMPFGLVMMILNHACLIYDSEETNNDKKSTTPMFYIDFNNKTNLCLTNTKQLSTNPYDILIPIQASNSDFVSILEPTVLNSNKDKIKGTKDNKTETVIFSPEKDDLLSYAFPEFRDTKDKIDNYRGRTMNILLSCDYLLKVVDTYAKGNNSGDIYVKEFVEQILFDINKSLGHFNIFRFAYDDGANTAYVVDDQFSPNLEGKYITEENKSKLPLFGRLSIAKSLEIRTEVSSKLSNMLAISANAQIENTSNLSKSTDSYGFYNSSYKDRYIPNRTEIENKNDFIHTDSMINSTIQFNNAISTFYGSATPAIDSVGHATNYYIERMSKLKSQDKGTRSSAMIPVSLNFSIDGISGLGMGHSFTIPEEFLPYTYNLSLTDPYGNSDKINTVGFVAIGLDQTIENNQWTSNVRANMIYLKKMDDFSAKDAIAKLKENPSGLKFSQPTDVMSEFNGVSIATKKLNYTAEQIKNAVIKKGHTFYETDLKLNIVGVRNSSTKNLVTNKFDDIITVTYKEGSEIKFYQFAITTDPGAYYVKNFFPGAVATGRMVPGQYINAYSIGVHRSKYEALVEVGPIKAFRDDNKDDIYDETNIQQGNFSMNIHKASDSDIGIATEIDDTSAGCQVFSSTQDFNNFMTIVKSSRTKLNSNSFTYTLLLSDDII